MGKMGKEIAGTEVGGTIEMLKKAYGAELSTFHYFWYIAQNILANSTKEKDNASYKLALDLLDAELEDEQNLEDILAKLEIS
jgi:ferritin-like protein